MKKIYSFLLVATLLLGMGGVAFAYDDGGAVNVKETSGGSPADAVRVYQLVRYPAVDAGGPENSLSAGDVVVWDTNSDDGVTVNSTHKATMSCDAVAGVVVSTVLTGDVNSSTSSAAGDLGRKNWGYIQTYGYNASCKIAGVVPFAGAPLCASPTDEHYAMTADSGTEAVRRRLLGFAYDTQAATGSAEVFVNTR